MYTADAHHAVVSFCVGTGRCGTTFLARLAGLEPEVAASHERLRLAATFHLYCKWNGLAVDPEGFLIDREAAVRADLADHRVSFDASALLSHSVAELAERFDARFLLLVRRPEQTVASFAVRRWFVDPVARRDASLPPSYREGEEPRHFFGRNLPRGAELERPRPPKRRAEPAGVGLRLTPPVPLDAVERVVVEGHGQA
jgi:hypothetical protein